MIGSNSTDKTVSVIDIMNDNVVETIKLDERRGYNY